MHRFLVAKDSKVHIWVYALSLKDAACLATDYLKGNGYTVRECRLVRFRMHTREERYLYLYRIKTEARAQKAGFISNTWFVIGAKVTPNQRVSGADQAQQETHKHEDKDRGVAGD